MNLVHLIAYLIAAALLLSGCAARPGQIALPDTPEVSESESEETEQPEVSETPVTVPVIAEEKPDEAAPDEPEVPAESTPASAPAANLPAEEPVTDAPSVDTEQPTPESPAVQTGWTENVTLDGADGVIHYSYYLPDSYDGTKSYPLVVTMPGYDRMWFGADSAGTNLSWNGVQAWTKLDTELIVVSAQLTDWGDTSARQANELAEYMIENFSVDTNRVYAAGYSAGGETMSRAVAMRPDLYAAYIHGGSQWDGAYDTVAENRVAVYIFMAEHDEYYGSQKARDAYAGLHDAYAADGLTEAEIDALLKLEIPDDAYFNERGIYNYHGGGSVVFDDTAVLNWILEQSK